MSIAGNHGGVIGVLWGAPAGPVLSTAAQRSAAVIGHDREAGQPLSDRTPLLGIFATGVHQDHRGTRPTDLCVQGGSVNGIGPMRGGSAPGSAFGLVRSSGRVTSEVYSRMQRRTRQALKPASSDAISRALVRQPGGFCPERTGRSG